MNAGHQSMRIVRAASSRAALLLVLLATGSAAFGDDRTSDERFVEGLRERRLYELAASCCEQRLERSAIDPTERTRLTIELMRVRGEQALHAPVDQQARWWAAAREAGERLLAADPPAVRRELVEVQLALLLVAEGELARQQAEVARGSQPDYSAALDVLRRAESSLESVLEKLEQPPLAPARSESSDELSTDERFALRNQVRLEHARLLTARAQCYPAGSADRIAAAMQANEILAAIRATIA